MTVEALLFAATTLIAVVAVVAVVVAVVAVRTVRKLKTSFETVEAERKTLHSSPTEGTNAEIFVPEVQRVLPEGLAPRVVQGRVVVPPSQAQVVRTALGRPGVRLNVFVHGLARALRAENRDRIVALMRREYRHRRRERLRAGRQAIRMSRPTSAPSTERLHAEFAEPKPLSLTDQMVRS